MVKVTGKRCVVNNTGQVVQDTIGDLEIIKINKHRVIDIVPYSIGNNPNTKLILCGGFIGFIVNNNIIIWKIK